MNYKTAVHETASARGSSNACVFATYNEADRAGKELLSRWTLPHHHSVIETDEPVNYEFPEGIDRPRSIGSKS